MTPTKLLNNLEKFSPFKFDGGTDTYTFKNNNAIYLDETFWCNYEIVDSESGLIIHNSGLMPFHQNVLIDFGEYEECVIVNYDGKKLIEYPNDLRHSAAIGGFFILKSLNIKK